MCLATAIYAALHFLVDLICAWAMFSNFTAANYENLLIYNFCAFALQMPFGTLLDLLGAETRRSGAVFALLGMVLTFLGALLHPALLGIGNALFHVGGGFDVIHEDLKRQRKGRNLGIFVAPGAVGLYVGTLLGSRAVGIGVLIAAAILTLPVLSAVIRRAASIAHSVNSVSFPAQIPVVLTACCFAVVILRSWIGLSVSFPWKSSGILAACAVCGAAAGKVCGGFLGARFGIPRTAAVTLLSAAVCYLAGAMPAMGILAAFFFNMTMPLTLYLLTEKMPGLAGFSFGLLTFGRFLGFLPVYYQLHLPMSGSMLGALGSIVTCILLTIAGKAGGYGKVPA